MSFFPQTVEAILGNRTIGATLLVFMDFVDAPRRWWPGFGDLIAGGYTWQGTGEFLSVSGLEQPLGTSAPKVTFQLSGVDPTLVTLAKQASDRVKNRRVTVYIQFLNATPDDVAIQPWSILDYPYSVWSGIMDQMTYAASGAASRSITLTAESLWTNRRRPAYGLYTDRDQNLRHPGDRGLEQVADLVTKTIRWPTF